MVSKCANPGCDAPFRYLHTGKLFRLDKGSPYQRRRLNGDEQAAKKPMRRVEFYWLCADCAKTMTLVLDQDSGVSVRHHLGVDAAA